MPFRMTNIFIILCVVFPVSTIFGGQDNAAQEIVPGLPASAVVRWVKGETPPAVFGVAVGMQMGKVKKALKQHGMNMVKHGRRIDLMRVDLGEGMALFVSCDDPGDAATQIDGWYLQFEQVDENVFTKVWTAISCADAYSPAYTPSGIPWQHDIKDPKLKISATGFFNEGVRARIRIRCLREGD